MSIKKSLGLLIFSLAVLSGLYFLPPAFQVDASVINPGSTPPPPSTDFDTNFQEILAKIKTGVYGTTDMGLSVGPGTDITDLADLKALINGLSLNGASSVAAATVCNGESFLSKDGSGVLSNDTGALTIDGAKVLDTETYCGTSGAIATQTLSDVSTTVSEGFYNATTLDAVDADLAAGNILTGTTIFGVAGSATAGYTYGDGDQAYVLVTATGAGTALQDLFHSGCTGACVEGTSGGGQISGGVEDYNNGNGPTVGAYSKGWTICNAGNSYCGTSDAGAAYRDDSTGLIWSQTMNSGDYSLDGSDGSLTWFIGNNCNESGPGGTCTKKASSKTGCEANVGWAMPHQKQLMQAYIDGAYGKLDVGAGIGLQSATTLSSINGSFHAVDLAAGLVFKSTKTGSDLVRCVWVP